MDEKMEGWHVAAMEFSKELLKFLSPRLSIEDSLHVANVLGKMVGMMAVASMGLEFKPDVHEKMLKGVKDGPTKRHADPGP